MIYLIDIVFRIRSALNNQVNQVKYPGTYNECLCLGCKSKVDDMFEDNENDNDNVSGIVNVNDNQGNCFADDNVNVNANVNGNVSYKVNVNQGTCFANDNVNDNYNENDNDNDNDNDKDSDNDHYNDKFINQFSEKHQRGKPITHSGYTDLQSRLRDPCNNISINVNGSLQSWLADNKIIVNAKFPGNVYTI